MTTLLVLAILSTVVVAFMQSMSTERLTAASAAGIFRAELAVQSATQEAIGKLLDADDFPVSAYQEYGVAGTMASYLTMVKPSAAWNAAAETKTMSSFIAAPSDAPATETVDINATVRGEASGWIGLADAGGNRRKVPVQWIYIYQTDATGNFLLDKSGKKIPVARYAYWIDDESARLDISQVGSVSGTGNTHEHKTGNTAADISLHALFNSPADVKKIFDKRVSLRNFCYGLLGHTQLVAAVNADWKNSDYDKLRASIAWETKPDERGATGYRRLDINEWATGNDNSNNRRDDYATPAARQRLADRVVAMGDYINAADPTFAMRFYSSPSDVDKRQYCVKLAANIQDYIDADSQPTVIRNDFAGWQEPPIPTDIGEGTPDLPPVAFGKEVVPAIGEYMGYYYSEGADRLRIDHTFEVWNIHTKPIDFSRLGNVKILMAERNQITPGTSSNAPTPDMLGAPGKPPLALALPSTASIASGTYALLTTLPNGQQATLQGANADISTVAVLGNPPRIFITPREGTYSLGTTGNGLRMEGDQLATNADVDTEILVANQYGYLDIQPRVAQQGAAIFDRTGTALCKNIPTQSFGNNPASSGNNTDRRYPLDSGDPRSFTEVFPYYSESGGNPSVIAWRRNTSNALTQTNLGGESANILPANTGTATYYVPEPIRTANMNAATDAISVIRDGKMKTIGELGFIYDPSIPGTGYENSNVRKRGGFRTLTVGSKMGEDEGPNRLTQVNETNRASRLLELFDVFPDPAKPNTPPPRILLNSILRNPSNLPLRATIENLNTQLVAAPHGGTNDFASPSEYDTAFVGKTINTNNLISALETDARTTNPINPFFYLGQLARLPIFNTGTELIGVTIAPNAQNKKLMDRGREEVFRRLVGSLCLKGSRFRIYAIAQPLDRFGRPRGITRLVTLVELQREYADDDEDGTLGDPLDDTSKDKLLENNKPEGVRAKTLLQLRY